MTEGVWCFIICFGTVAVPSKAVDGPVDTFCHSYQRVVRSTSELEQVLKLDRSLRDRIQGNDLDYLCRCTSWKNSPAGKKACTSMER